MISPGRTWSTTSKIIDISRGRLTAGDIAQIDLDRIELLRVQYESEMQTAECQLAHREDQLLQLMDDRTPVEKFDVLGAFDFAGDREAARTISPDRPG